MAQLLLQQGKVPDALKCFERAAELSRTEAEIVNALSYAEATRTQLEVSESRVDAARTLVADPIISTGSREVSPTSKQVTRSWSRRDGRPRDAVKDHGFIFDTKLVIHGRWSRRCVRPCTSPLIDFSRCFLRRLCRLDLMHQAIWLLYITTIVIRCLTANVSKGSYDGLSR